MISYFHVGGVMMDFLTYVNEHKEEIIDELKALLRIPSVLDQFDENSETPFGEPIQEALNHMISLAKKDGFITKNIQNYAGHIEYGEGDDILGVLCHLDVVPPGDNWSNPPFSPVIKDGKIYARGSMDDKGPTIAAYFALKFLKDLDVKLSKRVRIILGTDEETAWRGIAKYFETEEMPTIGFAPDASCPLIYGEKGMLSFDINGVYDGSDGLISFESGERYNVVPDKASATLSVDLKQAFNNFLKHNGFKGEIEGNTYTVHGKNAHAMQPHLGVNAGFILAQFLNEHFDNPIVHFIHEYLSFDAFGEKLKIDYKHEEMKEFTINTGIIRYNQDEVRLGINCRYPIGFKLEEAITKIKKAAKKHQLTYHEKTNVPIHYIDPNDPLVVKLMDAYQKVTNDMETKPFTIGGGTYARSLKKAVAFGMVMPGRKDVAHQVDEHIFIDDLIEATAIYMEAIFSLAHE
jgi:succinyl-diaminopimelate desuccinylase